MLVLLALWNPALAQEAPPRKGDPGAPAADEALPIIEGPKILEFVDAVWPPGTKESGEEAQVTVLIELDEEGEVSTIDVVTPAGRGFDEAAVDAILQMKFAPARTEAGPVPVTFEFNYGFRFEPEEVTPEEVVLPVNLEGRIREMGTRQELEGIDVVVDGTGLTTKTDAEGRFQIRGAPLGTVVVRILSVDHVTTEKEVEIVEGEATILDLWVRSNSYRENEIVGVYERKKEEVTRRTITMDEVKRIPGTFGDPVKVIQTLPGAARSPFGTGLLVIRGSNPEDSGVYVDGVRLPFIFHITGTTSVLNPDVIQSVDYLPGGYGVQYGRAMGGVVDIKTKEEFSEQGKLVWGTDILDTQLYFEKQFGKKGAKGPKHQLALGARRSYIDAFIPLFTSGTDFQVKPRYQDYQIKYIAPLAGKQYFSTFVYGFEDVLKVGTPPDFAQGSDQDTQGDLLTRYSSQRIVLNYRRDLTDNITLDVTPSFGIDFSNLRLGDEFRLQNRNYVAQLRAEVRWQPDPVMEVIPGIDLFGGAWWFDFRSAVNFESLGDPLAEREPVGFGGQGSYWSPDVFLKLNIRPLNGSDRWLITPGIRGQSQYLVQGGSVSDGQKFTTLQTSWNPRISTRAEIVKGNTLKAATGIYSQPPQPQETIGIGAQSEVGYESAWNSSIGFEQEISQAIKWDIDLFYKRFSRLIVTNPNYGGPPDQAFINGGDGRAYGMEIILRHQPVGRFFGWVSYTLSKSERRDDPTSDEWYPFAFDQRHILSAQGGYDLPLDFGISAQVQFVTGNPDSPQNAGIYDADGNFYNGFRVGPQGSERLPPFFQTSLRFDRLWTFKRWQLETYVDLINLVRGVNPEFRLYNYDYSDSAFVRGLPLIPNIGLEAKFFL